MAKARVTPALEAITNALQPTGKLTGCIQAGFQKAIITSAQGIAMREHILATVELCQSQAKELEKLRAQLLEKSQLTI
ncbi:hypothetical protein [Spirosoma foliorum]|uniref:Uncharacterized protein n=1 Tax=Spirosoma foliorum TaxID=2710596 RepID=A0A7G5GYW1_9BACT|nr:hypothetical protein [Spirosoma foliorum]QMW04053.1 hypothetical protein H3H32_03600 [Spirosoma foliorum]